MLVVVARWGFYAFGCAALFYIWWILLVPGRKSAMNLGSDFHKSYITSTAVLSVLWLVYPIIVRCPPPPGLNAPRLNPLELTTRFPYSGVLRKEGT